ncbi:tetratricopeptide repeat protein [Desulfurispora thermophila]|uniref:tetratricopeptide repeat protein n=1 Tax=Desulfurispora thermophila TaxID=265470 RepID=UPI0003806316|nr:tetratricopeptide repeat protein [Desulfurispora thermophila]
MAAKKEKARNQNVKPDKLSRREKRRRQQRIVFGIVVAFLALGLIATSIVWSVGGRSNLTSAATANVAQPEKTVSPQEQIARLEKELQQKPDDVQVMSKLATAYLRAGQRDKGLALLEKAVQKQPDNNDLRLDLALHYFLANQNDKSIAELNQIIRRQPDNKTAHFYLGQVLALGKQDYKGGIVELEKYIELAKTGDDVQKARQMIDEWKKMIK